MEGHRVLLRGGVAAPLDCLDVDEDRRRDAEGGLERGQVRSRQCESRGHRVAALPHERLREVLKKYNRLR